MMEAKGAVKTGDRSWGKYFREVRTELKKVVWPTPKQTLSFTGFVVFFTLLVALIIVGLDTVFNYGMLHFIL